MSLLKEIISIVATIVEFVLKRVWDLICIVVYVVSCALPWRIPEIIEVCADRGNDWHSNAFVCLFITLVDCIAVPLGIVSLISPLQVIILLNTFCETRANEVFDKQMYLKVDTVLIILYISLIFSSLCTFAHSQE